MEQKRKKIKILDVKHVLGLILKVTISDMAGKFKCPFNYANEGAQVVFTSGYGFDTGQWLYILRVVKCSQSNLNYAGDLSTILSYFIQ